MIVSRPSPCHGPEVSDPPLLSVQRCVREYGCYFDALRFKHMHASARVLTSVVKITCCAIHILRHWVNCRLQGGEWDMFVSRGIGSKMHFPFVRCYKTFEYEKDLWTLGRLYYGQLLPIQCLSLIISLRFFVISLSLRISIIGLVIPASSFVYLGTPGRYMQSGMESNYFLFPSTLSNFFLQVPKLVARVRACSFTQCSDASHLYILLKVYHEALPLSKVGLAHCSIGVRRILKHAVLQPGLHWYQCVHYW